MNTISGYKSSGTIAATTSFQSIYSITAGTQGFITAVCQGSPFGMVMAYFQWSNYTYQTLTQLAISAGTAPTYPLAVQAPNTTTTGAQVIFLQITAAPAIIQMKTTAACTVYWYVTLM